MRNQEHNKTIINLISSKKIPEWIQYLIGVIVLSLILCLSLAPDKLKPSGKMRLIIETIRNGSIEAKSKAIWKLQKNDPSESASAVFLLIDIIGDETTASREISEEYHRTQENLAAPFADLHEEKEITIGDLAVWSIRRIRQNLVIECVGDGGPTGKLAAVRKAINENLLPKLCSFNESVKRRVLKVLLGDSDPTPIETVLSCGLSDSSPNIRALSAGLFITYACTDKGRAKIAVPKLIELLDDPDESVSLIAHKALALTTGYDMGSSSTSWKEKN